VRTQNHGIRDPEEVTVDGDTHDGLMRVLKAFGTPSTLTKLGLRHRALGRKDAETLSIRYCTTPVLQSLDLEEK
jgi:hypothetical protein